MTPWLTPGQVVIVLAAWAVPVVAGYALGAWKGRPLAGVCLAALLSVLGLAILALLPRRTASVAKVIPDRKPQPLTPAGWIQSEPDEKLAQTDSWIWRLPATCRPEQADASEGAAWSRGPLSSPMLRRWDGQQSK